MLMIHLKFALYLTNINVDSEEWLDFRDMPRNMSMKIRVAVWVCGYEPEL